MPLHIVSKRSNTLLYFVVLINGFVDLRLLNVAESRLRRETWLQLRVRRVASRTLVSFRKEHPYNASDCHLYTINQG